MITKDRAKGLYKKIGDEEMVQNIIHEKYVQELREIRSDVKTWKCANMGYNNKGISVDEGLEIKDADAIMVYSLWEHILDKANSIFDKIMNEESIKDEQKDKRRKELQKFFTDTIVKDILDGYVCKGCMYHSDSKYYCFKGWEFGRYSTIDALLQEN